MLRHLGIALAGAGLLLVYVLSPSDALPPCEHEDGPAPCYWDAQQRGNKEGTSFVLLGERR